MIKFQLGLTPRDHKLFRIQARLGEIKGIISNLILYFKKIHDYFSAVYFNMIDMQIMDLTCLKQSSKQFARGVTMLGHCATKLIHEAAMALRTRNSLQDVTVQIFVLSQNGISLLRVERASKSAIDSNVRSSLIAQ